MTFRDLINGATIVALPFALASAGTMRDRSLGYHAISKPYEIPSRVMVDRNHDCIPEGLNLIPLSMYSGISVPSKPTEREIEQYKKYCEGK